MQKIKVLIVTVGAVLTMLVMASCETNKGVFLLTNKATESITRASVIICRQTIDLKDIQPTQSAQGSYKVMADSHFDITVEFQSGKTLHREIGYVTSGFDYKHEMVVTDVNIEIVSRSAKPNSWIDKMLR